MYNVMHLPGVIEIGVTGENQFRRLEFDMRPWLEVLPGGVGSIVHIRPGETGDDAYVAATTMEDGILTWELTAGDVGEVEGYGQMEIWLEDPNTARGKSTKCQTYVRSSLALTHEIPEAQEAWLEQMTGLKTETVIAAQSAEDAKEAAESAQTAAEAARDAAQAAAGDFQGLSATASGLAAGTSPTVNVTHGEGGLFNLAFGIPKGDKGDQGDPPTDSQVQTAANNYLSQVITNPDSPPLDRALSSNAAAAPADLVGDLKSALTNTNNTIGNVPTDKTVQWQISEVQNKIGVVPLGETIEDQINGLKSGMIPFPVTPHSKYGNSGQNLRTLGNGQTEWTDQGLPTMAQVAAAVDAWLDEHPEATTTVQDHSITYDKLVLNTLGFVIPQMYGAKGDGTTDDTDAIQAALDDNEFVFFPAGEYSVSGIVLHEKNKIMGAGDCSIISANEEADSWVIDTELNAAYCTICNISIKGANGVGCMRMYADNTNTKDTCHNIENVRCVYGTIGINISESGNRANFIKNARIYFMSSDGINAERSTDNKIVGCEIGSCEGNGYNFNGSANNQMTSCKDFLCGGNGSLYYGVKCGSYMTIVNHVSQAAHYSSFYVGNYNIITGLNIYGCNYEDQQVTPTYFFDYVRINNTIEASIVDGTYGNASYIANPVQTFFLDNHIIINQNKHNRQDAPIVGSVPFSSDDNTFLNMANVIIIGGTVYCKKVDDIIKELETKTYSVVVTGDWTIVDNFIKKSGNVVMLSVNLRYTGDTAISGYSNINDITFPEDIRPSAQLSLLGFTGGGDIASVIFLKADGHVISNKQISKNTYITLRTSYII